MSSMPNYCEASAWQRKSGRHTSPGDWPTGSHPCPQPAFGLRSASYGGPTVHGAGHGAGSQVPCVAWRLVEQQPRERAVCVPQRQQPRQPERQHRFSGGVVPIWIRLWSLNPLISVPLNSDLRSLACVRNGTARPAGIWRGPGASAPRRIFFDSPSCSCSCS